MIIVAVELIGKYSEIYLVFRAVKADTSAISKRGEDAVDRGDFRLSSLETEMKSDMIIEYYHSLEDAMFNNFE